MQSLKMQPTFTLDAPLSADEAVRRLRQALTDPQLKGHAIYAGRCIDFQVEATDQRFWSPHLSVQVGDTESGSRLYCRFSPRPEIWTMFMAIYAVVLTCVFGAMIYGYVQWFMGSAPWSLVIVPVGSLLIVGLHFASLVGQSLSSDQMERLRGRLDHAVEIAFGDVTPQASATEPCEVS